MAISVDVMVGFEAEARKLAEAEYIKETADAPKFKGCTVQLESGEIGTVDVFCRHQRTGYSTIVRGSDQTIGVKLADGSMKWVQSSKAKRVADLSHPDVQPVIADKVQYHFGKMLDAWFAANR